MLKKFEYKTVRSAFEILLTAERAYPALEREFLNARAEIWASFRIFDLTTRLRSDEARAIGETWFDLIIHTLKRGVALNIVITDFDPVARPALHRMTWRSLRRLVAAAELAGPKARLKAIPAMHPARTGVLPRLVFWPMILGKQIRAAAWLNRRPLPVRDTAIREMPGLAERLVRLSDGRFRPRLWPLPCLYPATHHQKLAVFDRKRLYIGGLDLDERRYDTPDHDQRADETWHDVQLLLDGPAATEAQAHLESFLDVTAGRAEPPRHRALLRTLSRRRKHDAMHFGPEPLVQELATAHEHYARRTRRLIYLETQYFRDLKLARYLAGLAAGNPGLGMILILPGAPEEIAFKRRAGLDARFGEFLQARALKILMRSFGRRLFIGGAAQPRAFGEADESVNGRDRLHGAPLVYIHAKVSIFDDVAAIVSSANLNGRSLRWDTEAGLLVTRRPDVQALRRQVFSHWLPSDAGDGFFDGARAVPEWRRLALENARKAPADRAGFILPYDLRAAESDAASVPLVPDEMV
ncbi:phospholipase D-like domain-containing protein [Defluviimonas sp. SAOS-178_SWC]|uniref:phospholipase D-like domain-containing protein n=1 Tax=Defluviimonas sp. SAOS-178_SWC TaxID=3121287 RepID=UPI00322149E0